MAYTAKLLIRDVVCVGPDATVTEAARVMTSKNIGAAVVGTMARPEGILSERDVCRRVVTEGKDPAKTLVKDVMTKKPVTVDAAEPLDKVFERLSDGRFRHIPITDKGEVVGIVSLTDLARVLQEVYRDDKYLQYFADVIQGR